jgi:RNA polymerase sigma-70 factor (ECF subfamily)
VELNRAVAIAMRDGPLAGLTLIEQLMSRGDLSQYHLAHAAVAELSRRLGKTPEARRSFEMALSLARQETERRFLQKRIQELEN